MVIYIENRAVRGSKGRIMQFKTPMLDPCYYCLCNSCVNNVESRTVNVREVPNDYDPCFICDDCCVYDGDCQKKNMEIEKCKKYIIDDYHAQKNRKKIKII